MTRVMDGKKKKKKVVFPIDSLLLLLIWEGIDQMMTWNELRIVNRISTLNSQNRAVQLFPPLFDAAF